MNGISGNGRTPLPLAAPDALGYLDHAASTPVRPEVVEAMLPFLTESFANPSGAHLLARKARRAVDGAREELADLIGAKPGEVVFTSGGTEADNMAVLGVHDLRGGALACSAVEHHAVLDPVLSRGGRLAPVGAGGVVDLDALGEILREAGTRGEGVALVAVMLVNNEVGTIQPIDEVAAVVGEAGDAVLHVDAVQALNWLDISTAGAGADLLALSAHKLGGPKGVGALVLREGTRLAPRQLGGGQERERRSGTQNVAGAVGMAVAARLAVQGREARVREMTRLRARLADGLVASVPGLVETVPHRQLTVPGICHVCIEGVDSEALLLLLEGEGVYASAASSCSSGAMEPSHVLAAMDVAPERSSGSLRLSLGWTSTDADVDLALAAVPPAVERLRSHSLGGKPA